MVEVTEAQFDKLEESLLNTSGNTPLHARFRALFTLKSVGGPRAISIISKGFQDESALLKHEFAYVLGQLKDISCIPVLESVLANEKEDPMVRHEAAEALGAIGQESSIQILTRYLTDSERAVRETCEIALDRIKWQNSDEGRSSVNNSQYTSIDPAPSVSTSPFVEGKKKPAGAESVSELKTVLMDTERSLFDRYRAMFSLRNIGSDEAVEALATGFSDDSALFRHEVAFVFGQLVSPHSVPFLIPVLENSSESEMVRHEAAEALGAIATQEVLPVLKEWMSRPDAPRVVRESCAVAVDMWEYENSGDFQYANTLIEPTPSTVVVA